MENLERHKINSSISNISSDWFIVIFLVLAILCIGRLWTLLLMMQIVSNIDNYSRLVIPAQAKVFLEQIE